MDYYHQQPVQSQPVYPPPPPPSAAYYASPAAAVASHHHQPKASHSYASHYPRVTSTSLGAAELFMAVISITGGIMAFVYDASMDHIGTGIWCGIFYLIAGSVALAAGQNPSNSLISSNALTSGLNIAFGITELTIASIGVSNDIWCGYYQCVTWKSAAVAANCLMICAGSWQVIFGIWLFAVSCYAVYRGSDQQASATPVTYAPGPSEAVFLQVPGPMPQQPMPYYQQAQYAGPPNQQYAMHPPPPPMQVKGQHPYPEY